MNTPASASRRLRLAATLLPLLAGPAFAADYFWDVNGSAAGLGGNASFNTGSATAVWSTDPSGLSSSSSNVTIGSLATHNVNFTGTTGGVVTFASNLTAAAINVTGSNYEFRTASTATRELTGLVTLGSGLNLTVSSGAANAAFGFVTNGISSPVSATLTLAGSSTATNNLIFDLRGSATVAASVPIVITGGAGSAGVTIRGNTGFIASTITNNSSASLTIAAGLATGNGSLTVNGVISGSQPVTFTAGQGRNTGATDAGQIILGAASDYTGETRFNGTAGAATSATNGSVKLNIHNALSTASSGLVMGYSSGRGENLDLNGFNQSVASLTSNSGGTGAIINTLAGTTSTLTINGTSTTGSFGLPITNGSSADRRVALTRAGSGTTTLTNINTYTGGTTVSGGTLVLGHATNTLADTGAIIVSGGTLDLGSNNDTVGGVTISSGSITGTGTLTPASVTATGGTIEANLAGASTTFTTTGGSTGTVVLSGNNTFGGVTWQNSTSNVGVNIRAESTTALSPNSQFRTGPSNNDTAVLNLAAAGNYAMSSLNLNGVLNLTGPASGSSTLTFANGGFLSGTASRNINVSSGATLVLGADSSSTFDIVSSTASANRQVAFVGTGAVTVNSVLQNGASGSAAGYVGGLTKSNTGTVTLTADNTYSGGTSISNGTLALSGSGTFGTGSITISGGTIDLGTKSITNTLGSVTGGTIANGAITNDGGSYDLRAGTISARLSGSNGLQKSGTGLVTLSGANDFTGDISVADGTLALGAAQTLGGRLVLGGGALDAGTFTSSFGALDLDATASITLGSGARLSFGDSSAQSWGGFTLSFGGSFTDGQSLRFGSSGTALSAEQLASIRVNEISGWALTADGYLTAGAIPEPASAAALAGLGLLGFAALRRRRRA